MEESLVSPQYYYSNFDACLPMEPTKNYVINRICTGLTPNAQSLVILQKQQYDEGKKHSV